MSTVGKTISPPVIVHAMMVSRTRSRAKSRRGNGAAYWINDAPDFGRKALMKLGRLALILLALGPLAIVDTFAETFPSRAIQVVIPYAAGGPIDAMARILFDMAGKNLRQPIIVVSRPGASTIIGTRAAAAAPADGYTLLANAVAIGLNPLIDQNAGYKLADFVPLAPLGTIPQVLVVRKSFPANNFQEFIAAVEAAPGKYSIGTLGGGSPLTLLTDRFLHLTKLKMVQVPYKGATDGQRGLLTGEIDAHLLGVQVAYPIIASGAVKAFAVGNDRRHRLLPDTPTFQELSLPEMNALPWVALFARADTPKPILDTLVRELSAVAASEPYRENIEKAGGDVWSVSPDDLAPAIERDMRMWKADIDRVGAAPKQ
jgi:tripartite-type tricarboxylate transporter receptor subunit TctC